MWYVCTAMYGRFISDIIFQLFYDVLCCLGVLLMGFPDVAFLPSRASLTPHFLKKCCNGESLMITICLRTVVGGRQAHALCKIL